MRRAAVWLSVVAIGAALGWNGTAFAQLPVCPPPAPDELYYTACVSTGRLPAARLLFDLAIDHSLKADNEPVQRRVGDILRMVMAEPTLEGNGALRTYADSLEPIRLVKLDTSTGSLRMTVPEEARSFAGTLNLEFVSYEVSWQLPERIRGGYWRTPGVLQVAFWEGQRPAFRLAVPGGLDVAAEVECLVVSTDGLRVTTAGASVPDILVRFDECG
jgi:hypothetical protein